MQAQVQPPQPNGIAALAQGNAAPMQPQQPQVPAGPPQGLPPDLKQLLAQQARNELQQAAQRYQALQQALQMGQGNGKPPTVAQQVELQGQQMQQAPQAEQGLPGLPEQPMARGGLIHLPSDLPSEYAGGGIVAFKTGDSVEDEESKAMEDLKRIPEWLREWWAEQEAARDKIDADSARVQAARKATIDGRQKESLGAQIADYFTAPKSEYADRFSAEAKATPAPMPEYRMEGHGTPVASPMPTPQLPPDTSARMPNSGPPPESFSTAPPNAIWTGDLPVSSATLELMRVQAPQLYASYIQKFPPPAPQAAPEGIAAAPGAQQSQHPLADPLNKSLTEGLQADPRKLTEQDITRMQQYRGLPELLKQQQAIIDAQQARQAAAAENRIPAWAMGGMNAKVGSRQDLGSFLASMGKGAVTADANYAAADEANAAKIDGLRTKMIEAQLAGNEKDAAGYQALLQDNLRSQSNAQQSAASVLNTAENAGQRRDAAEGRLAELRMRNTELQQRIKEGGDTKLLTQVSMIQKAAAAEATKRAITEVKERDPFASESSPLVASKAAQYEAEALAGNVVYQKALKEYMGAGYVAPKAAPDTNNLAAAAAAELARRGIK